MDDAGCVREFEKLAKRMGIELRYNTDGPSGLCTVHGKHIMFIDRSMDDYAKLRMYIREFRSIDLSGYFVVPIIRDLLGKDRAEGDW